MTLLLLCAGNALATTWVVDPGGAGDFLNIQDAVDAAASGDTIEIVAGTYVGGVTVDEVDLSLVGRDGAAVTVLTDPLGTALTFSYGGDGAVVDGLTLADSQKGFRVLAESSLVLHDSVVRGNGTPNLAGGGGALAGGALRIANVAFSDNIASNGGDLHASDFRTLTVVNSSFARSSATNGGAIAIYHAVGGEIQVKDSSFEDEYAVLDGGAIYQRGGQLSLDGVLVRGSFAGDEGGGLNSDANGDQTIRDSVFEANEAGDGGAVYSPCGTSIVVEFGTFNTNRADGTGGAVSVGCGLEVADSTFESNEALDGGAIWSFELSLARSELRLNTARQAGALHAFAGATIEATTFADNSATDLGGAVLAAGGLQTVDSTFSGNLAETGGGVYVQLADWADLASTFEGNGGSASGGGAYVYLGGDVELTGTLFSANEARFGGAFAVYDTGRVVVRAASILGNSASRQDGGLELVLVDALSISNSTIAGNTSAERGAGDLSGDVTLTNNLVVDNTATEDVGGFRVSGTHASLVNNAFVGNSSPGIAHLEQANVAAELVNNVFAFGSGAAVSTSLVDNAALRASLYAYNNLWANDGGGWTGAMGEREGIDGNIAADPLFSAYSADGDVTNDDLRLTASSPCVDAGDPVLLDPDASRSDMGAYGGPGATLGVGCAAVGGGASWGVLAFGALAVGTRRRRVVAEA